MSGENDIIFDYFIVALKYLSQTKDISNAQIAKMSDILPTNISRITNGSRPPKTSTQNKIAQVFGYDLIDFLALGRSILNGEPQNLSEEAPPVPAVFQHGPHVLEEEEMAERGFIAVPYSAKMELAAGKGGTVIPVTDDEYTSKIVVHGPTLGHYSARHLQAFRVGGDSMEPVLARNGIILADKRHNDIKHFREGRMYVLCWDIEEGECAVKYLRWAEKDKWVSIESANLDYKPVFKRPGDVVLIGHVIWSWRTHE